MDSKVSIIIPTYNRSRLLANALDSVYRQTRRNFEVILVDDGSLDDTRLVATTYLDRLVYQRIEHAGASVARNVGLALALGRYVAFLDSDDLWEPDFLERMTAALDAAPGAGFAYCDYATFGAHGRAREAYLPPPHKQSGSVFTALLETDFLSTGALMIRRSCFQRVGPFDRTLALAEDWDLWLRLAWEFDAVYVDAPLVRIRESSDGLTRDKLQLHASNLRVLAKWRRAVAGNGFQEHVIRRNVCASHRAMAKHHWAAHQPLPALKHGVLSLTSEFR